MRRSNSVEPADILIPETDILAWQHRLQDLNGAGLEEILATVDELQADLEAWYQQGKRG